MGNVILNLFEKYSLVTLNFLLKQTIYTVILFVIILAISFLLRKKSPHWHFGLWLLILIRLLLPTDLNFSVSIRNIFDQIPNINKATASIDSISKNIKINQNSGTKLILNHISGNQKANVNAINNSNQRTDESIPWYVLAAFIWITGCLLMLIVILRKYLKSHYIIKNSSFIHNDIFTNLLTHWRHRLKIKRTVRIISSEEFLSPFSVGILKPLIHIPQSLIKSADMDTIHSIIAHEMVHIKHYDALWIKLQTILQIVYFFNPIIWYANRQINITREQICDSTVLSDGIISPRVYGNSIIQVLNHNLFGSDIAELLPCFGNHKKIYKQRIQKIIKGNLLRKPKTALIVLAICLIGFFVLPLASNTNALQYKKKSKDNDAKFIFTNLSPYNINNSIESNPKDTGPENLKHTQSISRSEIQQKVYNIDNVLRGLRVGPYRGNGNIEGYKLFMVSPTNILYKLGARSGDIVKRVNGQKIDSTEKLPGLWELVQGESKVTMDLERDGKLHIFELHLKDEGNNSNQGNNSLESNSKDTGSESLKYIQSISKTRIWLIKNNGLGPLDGLRAGGPYKVNGKIEGYNLIEVSPYNFLYEFGARSGDILKRGNGEVIDSLHKLMGLQEIMLRESKITLDIERGGKLHIFEFSVKDEGNNSSQENNFIVPFDKNVGRIRGLGTGKIVGINPISGMMELHFKIGIIFSKPTFIFAAASGEVIKAGLSEGNYGNLIILKHSNGYSTIYANLNKILVKEGQAVKSGDTIAFSGFSGFSDMRGPNFDDPDFRYEIRKGDRPIVISPPEKCLLDITIDPITNEIRSKGEIKKFDKIVRWEYLKIGNSVKRGFFNKSISIKSL